MDTECIIMMKFGSQTIAVDVEPGFSYKNLVSSCLGRWRQIGSDSVSFKYSIEGHPNCFLTCQADLVAMLKLFKLLKKPLINVEVVLVKDCNVGSSVVVDKRQQQPVASNSALDLVVKECNVVVNKQKPLSNSVSDQVVVKECNEGSGGVVDKRKPLSKVSSSAYDHVIEEFNVVVDKRKPLSNSVLDHVVVKECNVGSGVVVDKSKSVSKVSSSAYDNFIEEFNVVVDKCQPVSNVSKSVSEHFVKDRNVGSDVVVCEGQPAINKSCSVLDGVVKDCDVGLSGGVIVDKGRNVSKSATDQLVGSSSADLPLEVVDVDDENEKKRESSCKADNAELLSLGWSSCISHVGQGFRGGAVKFRVELMKYALVMGFKYDFAKNNKVKVVANCSKRGFEGCRWTVAAARSVTNKNWFYIVELNNVHTCCPSPSSDRKSLLSAAMMADMIVDEIKANPTASAKYVQEVFSKSYGLVLSYSKCYRALEAARNLIFGRLDESFQELKGYCEAVKNSNVGSFVDLNVDPTSNRFKRMFVAFGASIHGFNYCRPLLFVGRTLLKSRYEGTLLVATGKDAEDDLYPLAFAVVDAESEDNWLWFMRHLRTILDPTRRITIISDTACGLVDAIPAAFGESTDHFYCLEHLKEILRSRFSSKGPVSKQREMFIDMFSDCAYAPSVPLFNVKVEALNEEGGEVVDKYINSLPIDKWNNAYGPRNRYGEMYSNPVESINSWVSDVKGLPVMFVFETIRVKLMSWFNDRRTQSMNWSSRLCPKKAEFLTSYMQDASTWNVERSFGHVYNVFSDLSVSVNLDLHTCTCELWQVYGFPCVHAVAAVCRCDKDVTDIVESFFYVNSYRSCYAETIAPVPTMLRQEMNQQVADSEILPPETRRQRGDSKKRRLKSGGETTGKIRKCHRCGGTDGHNSASCTEVPNAKEVF